MPNVLADIAHVVVGGCCQSACMVVVMIELSTAQIDLLQRHFSATVWCKPGEAPHLGEILELNGLYVKVTASETVKLALLAEPVQRLCLTRYSMPAEWMNEWVFCGRTLRPYFNGSQDWDVLQHRYTSRRKYKERTIHATACQHVNDFKDWLTLNGATFPATVIENERFRFFLKNYVGIVYTSWAGNLLAHDIANIYHAHMVEIGEAE